MNAFLVAAGTTATQHQSVQQMLQTHKHMLLVGVAIVVLVIVGLKIMKHLAVIAGLAVAGLIAIAILFPGVRAYLPGSGKQAKTQATQVEKRAKPCIADNVKTSGSLSTKDVTAIARCIGAGAKVKH